MSWAEVFLGVIAVATLLTALLQLSIVVGGWLVARKMARMLDEVRDDFKPLTASLNAAARDVAKATSMATAQVERVDRLVSTLTMRVEETAATVQSAIITPLRQGGTVVATARAVMAIVKEFTRRPSEAAPARAESEEDPLFIG